MVIHFKYFILLCACLIGFYSTHAQLSSQKGWFETDFKKGCVGLTVNVSITPTAPGVCYDPNTGIECATSWGDGTENRELTHTYTAPGTYTLSIIFSNDDGADQIEITITESNPPTFNLYACTGLGVAVEITSTEYDNYLIDFGDGSQQIVTKNDANAIHTFANSNTQNVTVTGFDNNAASNCPSNTKSMKPLNALPAGNIISLEVIANQELILNYSLADNILYQLQVAGNNNNTFAPFKTINSSITTDTIRGLNLNDNFYCFRIATLNACDNTVDNLSEEICSINANLSILDNLNQLSWATKTPLGSFDIIRNDNSGNPLVTVPSTTRTFDDLDISCNTNYCYTLVTQYNNGATSTSLPVCGTSFSTVGPDQILNISTVVNANSIQLIWPTNSDPEALITYRVFENIDGRLNFVDSTDSTKFTISTDTTIPHCYEIQSRDECGNETIDSILGCSIALSGNIDQEDNVTLSWPPYQGWQNGIATYTVSKSYLNGNSTNLNVPNNALSEVDNSNNQVIQYIVEAIPNDMISSSISNIITLIKPNNIYFPNAFTPDGDGVNDIFQLNGRFIIDFEMEVYNRWGELIYTTNSVESGWDGILNGQQLPEGTYAFKAAIVDQAGRTINKDGSIVLLRN